VATELTADEAAQAEVARRGRPSKYNWGKWCNGGWWELTQGTREQTELPEDHPDHADFYVDIETFRVNASAVGKTRGLRLTSNKVGDNKLLIKFYKPEAVASDAPGKVA
jgi:hypothetical protein